MIKSRLKYFLVILCFSAQAQLPKKVIVKGSVCDRDDGSPISGAHVVFADDKGRYITWTTDTSGKYFFEIPGNFFSKAEITCQSDRKARSKTHGNCYLSSDDKGIISLSDTNDLPMQFLKNFTLQHGCCYPISPQLNFKKNSTEIVSAKNFPTSAYRNSDSATSSLPEALDALVKTLTENPEIIIQFDAHCSTDEQNVDTLSLKRAEYAKQLLVDKGINTKRIVTKGWGTRKLKITQTQVKKASTKAEKEQLHLQNRRCVFRIISWDFKE